MVFSEAHKKMAWRWCPYLVVAALATILGAAISATLGSSQSRKIPQKSLDVQGSLNFGTMYDTDRSVQYLELCNRGNALVKIVDFVTPCSCTALVDTLPITIQPLESHHLRLELDADGRIGELRNTVLVKTMEGRWLNAYPVRIEAGFKSSVTLSQETLDFGELRAGELSKKRVTITVHPPAYDPVEIYACPDEVDAELTPADGSAGQGQVWNLDCSVDATTVKDKPLFGEIVLKTPSKANPRMSVKLLAEKFASVMAEPKALAFDIIRKSNVIRRELVVRSRDGTEFKILRVEPVPATPWLEILYDVSSESIRGGAKSRSRCCAAQRNNRICRG